MNKLNTLLIAMLFGCSMVPAYAADNAYTAVVVDDKVVKENKFSCTDSVYVFVEDRVKNSELTNATVRWTDPAGVVVRTQKRNFISTGKAGAYLWDGLEFNAGGGLFSNIGMSFLDPSSGLEDVVGKWTIKVDMPDRESFSLGFDVIC